MIYDSYREARDYFDTTKYMIHNEIWHDSNCKSKYNVMIVTHMAIYAQRVANEQKEKKKK